MLTVGRLGRIVWDLLCWMAAIAIVVVLRYTPTFPDEYLGALVAYSAVAIVGQLIGSFYLVGRYRNASFEEVLSMAAIVVFIALAGGAAVLIASEFVFTTTGGPYMLAVVAPPLALTAALLGRMVVRGVKQYLRVAENEQAPMLIIGAGDAGDQLYRLIRVDQQSPYQVIGFLDDSPRKASLKIGGVRVLGTLADLEEVVERYNVEHVTIAISDASAELISGLTKRAQRIGVNIMTLPPIGQMLGGRVQLGDMKQVTIDDVLGRRQVKTDLSAVSEFITGRRVLVTGAGGSIGSEIARQVHRLGPSELVLLDRDESALHSIQLDIYEKGLLDTRDMVLCDIRDREALAEVFAEHKPEIVFHTAALKHLPLLEMYPEEGWKTNVHGTLNLLELGLEHGVGTFVNISTDKATDPTTVLGRSKRLAEQLTSWAADQNAGRFVSVRFGNVLGSRGSMLWTFRHQIEEGGPVTVTHPDVERYFMTIPEACQLVLQAGAIGGDGEVLVLDMGEPVKILDVANHLIRESGKDIDIVFTGLRPGEKLTEVLVGEAESGNRPKHPLISHITVPPVDPATINDWHDEVVKEDEVLHS